jgi:hypothetical protein
MDRTKPPPHCRAEVHRVGPPGRTQYRLGLADSTDYFGEDFYGETPEAVIAEAWEHYDRITLPARVALLRELAAELSGEGSTVGTGYLASLLGAIMVELAKAYTERADALEAGKP